MHRLASLMAYPLLEAEGHKYDPAPGSAAFKLGVFSLMVSDRYLVQPYTEVYGDIFIR